MQPLKYKANSLKRTDFDSVFSARQVIPVKGTAEAWTASQSSWICSKHTDSRDEGLPKETA